MTTAANIEALTSDLDNLVARVELEIVPVEREVGALIRQVLERQLDFSTRKTLRKWQRTELEYRIADLVGDLVSMDLLEPDMHERGPYAKGVAGISVATRYLQSFWRTLFHINVAGRE